MTFTCPFCEKRFKALCILKAHAKRYHLDDATSCPICGKRYRTNHGLLLHVIAAKRRCDAHAALFYLMRSNRYSARRDRRSRQKAYELLKANAFLVR